VVEPEVLVSGDETSVSELEPGQRLGRYEVEATLGAGGMGVVYAAFDPELGRSVALKVMRPQASGSVSGGEAQARLLREAQAMAGLSHPNVIEVYDVGRIDRQVYVAMELVHGKSLSDWFEDGPHPWQEVIRVMVDAGRGLVAAHDKGIIHRDFKPANVLLGDDGRVRVLDFGLARSEKLADFSASGTSVASSISGTDSVSSHLPALTEVGAVMGTPAYMAPEQAAGDPVDARSDQFSFCITLYEGLFGMRPFAGAHRRERLRNARLGRVRPPPPGSRVPRRIQQALLRGLAPDPDARWPRLDLLLDVLSRPPTRPGRWIAAGAIGLGMAGVVATMAIPEPDACATAVDEEVSDLWTADRKTALRETFVASGVPYAADTWTRVETALDERVSQWTRLREQTCRDKTTEAGERDQQLVCLRHRRAELATLLEVFADADEDTIQRAVRATDSLSPLEECEAGQSAAGGLTPPPPDVATRVEALRDQLSRVRVLRTAGRYEQALEVARAAVRDATQIGYEPVRAQALGALGTTQEDLAAYDDAVASLEEAFYAAEACGHDVVAASSAIDLFFIEGYRRGHMTEAEHWHGNAEAAVGRLGEADREQRAELVRVAGTIALRQADYDEAARLSKEALNIVRELRGEDSISYASILGNLGVAQINMGDYDSARESFELALRISEQIVGPEHPNVSTYLNNLGTLEQSRGNNEAALDYFRRSYDIDSGLFGQANPGVAMALNNIGSSLALLGRDRESVDYFRRSIAAYEAAGDYDPIDYARPIGNLGHELVVLGEAEEGIQNLRRSIRIVEESGGAEHPELSGPCLNLGSAYLSQDRYDEALESMSRALRVDEKVLGPDHPYVAATLASMAEIYMERDQRDEALPLLERAYGIQAKGEGDPLNLAATRFALARVLWAEKKQRDRARAFLQQAEDGFVEIGIPAQPRLDNLRAWKREHGL
jgi:tetratricopeptide (TPR) repeat protein/predicted Ser/Thr protein kinase